MFRIPDAPNLFSRAPAEVLHAPFLPMTRTEMELLGWDECDVVLVTGDAYVDHAAFGMALVGRLLEAQGFRVGIIAQPDWHSADAFRALGRPRLYFGVTGGNMDSMVNRYTSDRKVRSDDAYTADGKPDGRPDRASLVYANRCREAFAGVPIVLGGIEASLRRTAHYDYWSDKVRRSALVDAKADILLYGNAERALVELTHRMAAGEAIESIRDIRGTAYMVREAPPEFAVMDSTRVDEPGRIEAPIDPYLDTTAKAARPSPGADRAAEAPCQTGSAAEPSSEPAFVPVAALAKRLDRAQTVIRLPSFEDVRDDDVLYAHANRVVHLESNPGNARALMQAHGDRSVWLAPPPIPLSTNEMDRIYELPYARRPHPAYGDAKIPAFEMIRFSITINRGCFGGCTFCSITEHEGRIIQSRSSDSVVREVERVRDRTPGFTGVISDLGGPTANMYRLACKDRRIEAACRRPSCVFPGICENMNTDHQPLIELYRRARGVRGVKKVLIASGVRYDLAVESPAYVKELVTHHVGGYLKIAPEHTEDGPLSKMLKPGMGAYDAFEKLFVRYSREAGKKQYLIPYFIAAHPGTTDEDMVNLALWLKSRGFKADQVQAYLPSPMASATAMYRTGKNPLRRVTRTSEDVPIPKSPGQRRLHKALLRYHDPDNWPVIRRALQRMGRENLIGPRDDQLVPWQQPAKLERSGGGHLRFRTTHTRPSEAPKPHPHPNPKPKSRPPRRKRPSGK